MRSMNLWHTWRRNGVFSSFSPICFTFRAICYPNHLFLSNFLLKSCSEVLSLTHEKVLLSQITDDTLFYKNLIGTYQNFIFTRSNFVARFEEGNSSYLCQLIPICSLFFYQNTRFYPPCIEKHSGSLSDEVIAPTFVIRSLD